MLSLYVLEQSAEEREKLVHWLQSMLSEDIPDIEYVPRISVRPISFDELKFAEEPDAVLIGPSLLNEDLTWISKVRRIYPKHSLLACTDPSMESLSHIEQIARLGANDTLSRRASSGEVLKKLVLIMRGKKSVSSGMLTVVDSGKGGVGVTSLVAALGELSSLHEKKTVLVDFDFETQDLSRFLQVRPFINESLQLMLEGRRPVSSELISQSAMQVWEDESYLDHIPPPPESDSLYVSDSKVLRRFVSFFEMIDEIYDVVIVDAGSARGALLKTLYRIADRVVFVLNRDPAALYPSVDSLRKLQDLLSAQSDLTVVDNGGIDGLPRSVLLQEFSRAAKLSEHQWSPDGIPYCNAGAKWPGSGNSFFSLTKRQGKEALEKLAAELGIVELSSVRTGLLQQFVDVLKERVKERVVVKRKDEASLPAARTAETEKMLTDITETERLPAPIEPHEIDSSKLVSRPVIQ